MHADVAASRKPFIKRGVPVTIKVRVCESIGPAKYGLPSTMEETATFEFARPTTDGMYSEVREKVASAIGVAPSQIHVGGHSSNLRVGRGEVTGLGHYTVIWVNVDEASV